MSNHTKDSPLVTFALFSYNQEKYIQEAVEGAFAQNYSPLEIVLSDDCSTDRTYEIMEEMTGAYAGPHKIHLRQNLANLGTVDHVINVAKAAAGEVFVVAAGDDVSLPTRTSELVKSWMLLRPSAIVSNYSEISDDGTPVSEDIPYAPIQRFQSIMDACHAATRYQGMVRNIPGYCAAYSRTFISNTPLAGEPLFNEDALFSYLLNLEGRSIGYIPKTLVKVRRANTSVSVRKPDNLDYKAICRREEKIRRGNSSKLRFYKYLFGLCKEREYEYFDSVWFNLRAEIEDKEFVESFYAASQLKRLGYPLLARTSIQLRFSLLRVFGRPGLWVMSRARDLINKHKL